MDLYELSFGKVISLGEHLAEVIIDDGIEMNIQMVEEYHSLLKQHFKAPINLLVNKLNRYTYTADAQQQLAEIPEIGFMAVVVYNRITELSTQALISVPRILPWHIEVFNNRKAAIEWLNSCTESKKAS